MKRSIASLCFLSCILMPTIFAQITFIKKYGGPISEYGHSVVQTYDSGYIVAGMTISYGAGSYDYYLVKTDEYGDTLWTKTYGGVNYDEAFSVAQTSDSGYIIVGYTVSYGAGDNDVYLIKTDEYGDTLWTRTYGGVNTDEGYSIAQTIDGGYIITGYTTSYGSGMGDVYLIKINSIGDTIWTRAYGGPSTERGWSVIQSFDGNYIATGGNGSDVYVIKVDPLGDTIWTKTYGGDVGFSIIETADSGFVIAGASSFSGYSSVYLIKIKSNGDTVWTKCYDNAEINYAWTVSRTMDGGYIIGAEKWQYNKQYMYLLKTDTNGDTIWTRLYGDTNDQGTSVVQTTDGGYIAAGGDSNDVYLVKTDENGYASIEEGRKTTPVDIGLKTEPNPFVSYTHILGAEKAVFLLFDINGRKVGTYMGSKIGENLPAGVYYIISENKNIKPIRIVTIK